jgi:hypothetical protein
MKYSYLEIGPASDDGTTIETADLSLGSVGSLTLGQLSSDALAEPEIMYRGATKKFN